jgi:prepilin-type N-terminal cleavage/methylation domain-containing protein/prepilin-type processing-associated H-X9-DG protein
MVDFRLIRSRSRHAHADCSGFSLVELLVVIAIMGVLISLLLPAIQAARESARRTQCMNNLKQISLATSNFESANKKLPRSAVTDFQEYFQSNQAYNAFSPWMGRQFSWVVLLLPFMEQQALYDQFDMEKNVFDQDNNPQAQFISSLLCPSDEAMGRYFVDTEYSKGKQLAKANYAAYVSPFHIDLQLLWPGALIATGQTLSKITDGTTNTIAFSEVRTLDHELDERGAWAVPWAGSSILSFDMHHRCADGTSHFYCMYEGTFRPDSRSFGQTQMPNSQGPIQDTLFYCKDEQMLTSQLDRMPCIGWIKRIGASGFYSASPRSLHPGGVNVVYVDGHTEFVSNDVDETTFAFRVSINDGQSQSTTP